MRAPQDDGVHASQQAQLVLAGLVDAARVGEEADAAVQFGRVAERKGLRSTSLAEQ